LAEFQGDMLPTFTGTTMWAAWELTCHPNYVRARQKKTLPPTNIIHGFFEQHENALNLETRGIE